MEQNRRSRHNCSHLFSSKELKTCTGEKIASSTNGAGITGYLL
jgi:hypothetical protein